MSLHSLPLFHRIAGQPVIVVGDGEAAEAKRRLIKRAGGIPTGEESEAARLAFVAMDGPELAAARLRARGLLVNVADRPDLCDFTLPSILERDPVMIAIGTGGMSAGLAKSLRLRLEAIVPQSLGRLARALNEARAAIRERWPDPQERRRAIDSALEQGGTLDPLRAESADAIPAWLASGQGARGGLVEIVLGSDDPDDLTLRQARWLGSADKVCHDANVPQSILARVRADAVLLPLDQAGINHDPKQLTVIIRRS